MLVSWRREKQLKSLKLLKSLNKLWIGRKCMRFGLVFPNENVWLLLTTQKICLEMTNNSLINSLRFYSRNVQRFSFSSLQTNTSSTKSQRLSSTICHLFQTSIVWNYFNSSQVTILPSKKYVSCFRKLRWVKETKMDQKCPNFRTTISAQS